MSRFENLSIRRKIVLAILASTISTLLVGAAGLLTFELSTYRRQALREMTALAKVLGTSSAGALAFSDSQGATDILSRLNDDPSIAAARLYGSDGLTLATYRRQNEDVAIPDEAQTPGNVFNAGRLTINHDVRHRGDTVGYLFLSYDLARVRARLLGYISVVLVAIAILIGFSFISSSVLQRVVSGPILELTAVARRITERQDYTVRARRGGGSDEIATLTKAFNQMLEAIHFRERELEASRQSMVLAQTAGRIGTFDWHVDSGRTHWSPEMEALYGLREGTFDGQHNSWMERIHPEDRERVTEASNAAAAGKGDLDIEFRILWPDSSVHWVVSRARYYVDAASRLRRVVGVNIDITDRKATEARLIEQAEELWRSNRELEQFAYVSSHDLQEPLRKVANYAQLLGSKYQGKLGEEADRYIQNVTDGVSRMRDLIQDLLAYSRLARLIPPTEPVDLSALISRLIEDLEPTIQESEARIDVGTMPVVQARPSQMQQLFQNLISNALKFRGPERPMIKISSERRDHEYVFSVKDNGIGFEATYSNQIFKVFQRLHPRGRYPGTGIGLAICKKIVEQHGGKIWVDSELGKGATFYFSIPLIQSDERSISAEPAEPEEVSAGQQGMA